MLRLEDFMEIQKLHHDGASVSEIARQLDMDRKTVRKYLKQAPREYERKPKKWKVDPYRPYLRERWELGVHNAAKLFGEIRKRGYAGGETQVRAAVASWRSEGQERAFVRFETAPGEQAQMDWGHFGNWGGKRLYGFALTLCWSRMRYVEFTQRQDAETLLNCMVHAFEFFGGVTRTVLTDNMKTVVVDRVDGQPRFHAKMLDFASYYGFVPRVCRPYRPETKGKIESTVRFIKGNFWPGIKFDSLAELNRQALVWCGEVNRRVHATTREIPQMRFPHEGLTPLNGQPAYDTSYLSHRQVAKDCLFSYRGNRYSVPHAYAGKSVLVREPLDSDTLRVFAQNDLIAEHKTATGKGAMVVQASHYGELPRRSRTAAVKPPLQAIAELHQVPASDCTIRSPRSSSVRCRSTTRSVRRPPMSLQSERLLNHMLRLRLSHLPNCYEAIAEEASVKNLPYLDFLEQTLEAESQAKHSRNVRLKTQWAHFPYNKGLDQFDLRAPRSRG